MDHRLLNRLHSLAGGIREPRDYFNGIRRHRDPSPDNLLIFSRRSPAELQPDEGTFAFHQRWVLIVALEGMGTVLVDRRPFRLTPARALLVPPLHLHGYERVGRRLLWLFVTFEWPGHGAADRGRAGPRRMDRTCLEHLGALLPLMPDQAAGSLASTHLHEVLHRLFPPSLPVTTLDASLIERVHAVIAATPAAKIRTIARAVGISESHLRARFRQESGMSLGRYARESRLRGIAIRMKNEGLSVQDAAHLSDYPDIFTFSRAFSKTLGYPPSQLGRATRASHGETGRQAPTRSKTDRSQASRHRRV